MERDRILQQQFEQLKNFNSHAHVERDWCDLKIYSNIIVISTHTLTWSVTLMTNGIKNTPRISTHTLTWSVTYVPYLKQQATAISTHTLTWSVTSHPHRNDFQHRISTHTLTWSVTIS